MTFKFNPFTKKLDLAGGASSGGDVVGPASSTTNNLASFADTTGKLIKDSGILSTNVVTNAGTSTDNRAARFDGATGKIIQNSPFLINDDGSTQVEVNLNGAVSHKLSNLSTAGSAATTLFWANSEVGGGDAFFRSGITGVRSWAWGISSTTLNYRLSTATGSSAVLGSTNIVNITTAGEMTKPLQPAFLAKSLGQPNVTGDGTLVNPVELTSEIYDQNSDYNNTTSTFTAPVTGKYPLHVQVQFSEVNASTSINVLLNTSNRAYTYTWSPTATALGSSATISFSHVCDMDAADTAQVIAQVSGTTKTVDIGTESYFSGFLAV